MRRVLLVILGFLAAGPAARADIVINELLPDPDGPDAGHEFVELQNPGTRTVPLGGMRLEFANGADPLPDWKIRWTASVTDSLAPGSRFLIVDTNWQGNPDWQAQVRLSLQNGPDALRLVRDGVVLDLVGYGELTRPEFFSLRPAPMEPGLSLARRPDGRNTGDNSADFRPADPSPGLTNFPDRAMEVRDWSVEPPTGEPQGTAVCSATIENTGLEDLETSVVLLDTGLDLVGASVAGLPAGSVRTLRWNFPTGPAGRRPLVIRIPLQMGADSLSRVLGHFQTGPSPVLFSEIQAAPDEGQGEWLEIYNRGLDRFQLGDLRLKDEDAAWRSLPALDLEPGGCVAVAQDTGALADWIRTQIGARSPAYSCPVEEVRVVPLTGWPTLNNSPPSDRSFSDRVWLADSLGVLDQVKLGPADLDGEGIPLPGDGRSLERVVGGFGDPGPSAWHPCASGTAGSPGCPTIRPAFQVTGPWLQPATAVLDRTSGTPGLEILLEIPDWASGFDLSVYDLAGIRRRHLAGDDKGPGPRLVVWPGTDEAGLPVVAGGYILVGTLQRGSVVADRSRCVIGVR